MPCLIDCRRHVRLPPVVIASLTRLRSSLEAGTRVSEAARQRKQQQPTSSLSSTSRTRCHVTCRLSGMSSYFCWPMTPPDTGGVDAHQYTFLLERGIPGGFFSVGGHLAVLARRGSTRSLSRGCGKRLNALE